MEIKSETIHARITPRLKHKAEAVFAMLGLSATEAITLFYSQVALQKGLPFEVRIPNKLTQRVIREARQGKGLKKTTLEELKQEFSGA